MVGGGTGAGKTTVARRLAERSGVSLYSTDQTIREHSAKLTAPAAPLLDQFRRMTMDQRWVLRDPVEMYRTFPWFHGEGFELLIEDLRSRSVDTITVVEGFRLLPDLVRPLVGEHTHALRLIPTPALRQPHSHHVIHRTGSGYDGDPQRALANLLSRDEIQTAEVAADAQRNGLMTMSVDEQCSIDATVDTIAKQFGL